MEPKVLLVAKLIAVVLPALFLLPAIVGGVAAFKIHTDPRSEPAASGIEAVVVGETHPVPVGEPAAYAWIEVGKLEFSKGAPLQNSVWRGAAFSSPAQFQAGERRIELPSLSVSQFKVFEFESRNAKTFTELGIKRSDKPGSAGVYVKQLALRPGEKVVIVEGAEPEVWKGSWEELKKRADELENGKWVYMMVMLVVGGLSVLIVIGLRLMLRARIRVLESRVG